jgi:hypothetical protein
MLTEKKEFLLDLLQSISLEQRLPYSSKQKASGISPKAFKISADQTRLELATSAVTGRHSNQLNY